MDAHTDSIYLNSEETSPHDVLRIISTMDSYTMAMMAAQQQAMMDPMGMGGSMMGHPRMGNPMGDSMMQDAMQRRMERHEQRTAIRAALDPMSTM